MPIKSIKIIYYYLTLLCIINLQLLSFGNFADVFNAFTGASSIVLAFFCMQRNIQKSIKKNAKFPNIFLVLFFGFYILETLYGLLFSNIGIIEYIKRFVPFTYVLLVYPIMYVLNNEKYRDRFLNTILALVVISLVVKTFVWWAYNYRGIELMHHILFEEENVWQRNGLIRIRSSCLDSVVLALCLQRIGLKQSGRSKYFALIIFMSWYALFVMQSRALLVTIGLTIYLSYFLRKEIGWKKLITVIALAVFAVMLFESEWFNSFANSFNKSTYSTSIRLESFMFYMHRIKSHYFLGLIPLETYESIKGGHWRYYISDLGLFSKFFEYGLVGFIIFNIPFVRNFYIGINVLRRKNILVLSIGLFILIYSYLSNDIYITKNIIGLPFLIAIAEVIGGSSKKTQIQVNT